MAKVIYKVPVPPDDPMFKEGWKVFPVKSAGSTINDDTDRLKKFEMSWVKLYNFYYYNFVKSVLSKELEKEVGDELISVNYFSLSDDDKMLLAMGCMNVLVSHSPTISEVKHFNNEIIEPAVKIKGFENCVFFEFLGRYYGVFDTEKDAYSCIEDKIFPSLR